MKRTTLLSAATPLAVGAPMDFDKPLIATLVMRML